MVQCHGFSGQVESVWIEQTALATFLKEVENILLKNHGSALLESMSPDNLKLWVQVIPNQGMVLLEIQLSHLVYMREQMIFHQIKGGFELEQLELKKFLSSFQI